MGYGPTHPHRLFIGLWSHHIIYKFIWQMGSYEAPEIANSPFIEQQTVDVGIQKGIELSLQDVTII